MSKMSNKAGMGVSGQPGTMNKTNTGSAGSAVGLSKGTEGPVVRMGAPKRK